mmetsp:Transcript_12791/g.26546  ORF Transcript_12791/g.26546 Transcript_12791/m.26546 type:complete len:440 (-) Transcript_12791:94-1413(-)
MPSTAFCLLLRLFTLRCSEKQMSLMLDHVDSPYIRLIGFLYLRFACEPSVLWGWVEPYLYDDEPVRVESSPSKPEITVGEYLRGILSDRQYHGTMLPRLPLSIEREIKMKLLHAEKIEERAQQHLKDPSKLDYFRCVGSNIRALYGDEENPVTWYDAVVDRVITRDEAGTELSRPKFVVTFPEYGNTETVSLGEVDMPSDMRGDDRGSHYSGKNDFKSGVDDRSRDRGRGEREWDQDQRGKNDGHTNNPHYGTDRNFGYGRDKWERDRYDRGWGRDDRRAHQRGYDHEPRGRGYGNEPGGRGYGNEPRGRDRDTYGNRDGYRQRSRSRDRDLEAPGISEEHHLMAEVLQREREESTAKGKAYAARPATFKQSLSVKHAAGSSIADSTGNREQGRPRKGSSLSAPVVGENPVKPATKKQKTMDELAAIEEKKRKLMAKYG